MALSICESHAMAEVETSRDDAVLTITLNRPDVLNAFNAELHKALSAALKEARAPEVRAVVLTGAGRGFCVGQDLTEFREAPRGHRRSPARELPPEHPGDPGAREAGDRRSERCGSRRRAFVRLCLRPANRGGLGELHSRVHQHRARSRLRLLVFRYAGSSARRARSSGSPRDESSAQPKRRPGGSCQKSSTQRRLRAEPPSSQRSSPRCRRVASAMTKRLIDHAVNATSRAAARTGGSAADGGDADAGLRRRRRRVPREAPARLQGCVSN